MSKTNENDAKEHLCKVAQGSVDTVKESWDCRKWPDQTTATTHIIGMNQLVSIYTEELNRLREIEKRYNELVKAINTMKNVSWP